MAKYRCKKCKEDLLVLMSSPNNPIEVKNPCLMVCQNIKCKMWNLTVIESEAIKVREKKPTQISASRLIEKRGDSHGQ